jgi:hypothetical protein
VTPSTLQVHGRYNWKSQPERLMYVGKHGLWHQFEKVDNPGTVWCEVLDSDLSMFEVTLQDPALVIQKGRSATSCRMDLSMRRTARALMAEGYVADTSTQANPSEVYDFSSFLEEAKLPKRATAQWKTEALGRFSKRNR